MTIAVIICRAEPGASETAERVSALGLRPVISPALEIHPDPDAALPSKSEISGFVFTSANGVRAYAAHCAVPDLPAWCVGPATAETARRAGFSQVHESAGDSDELARFIGRHSQPSALPLLHVANSAAKGHLAQTLQAMGYHCQFAPLYHARAASGLSDQARQLIAKTGDTVLLVHSEKGAETFIQLRENLPLQQLVGVAISERAARPLWAAGLGTVHIAPEPNEEALLQALQVAAVTLST